MRTFAVDLHIHSALSPCAEGEMSPPRVLEAASRAGLDMIAITDHNSTLNVPAFCQAARRFSVAVVPGIEIQTEEEIHLVSLFPSLKQLRAFQFVVDKTLPPKINREQYFGVQAIMDAEGRIIGKEERLLLNSLRLSLDEALAEVDKAGGICIAAHIDRQAFSMLGVLGLIPGQCGLVALEVSNQNSVIDLRKIYPGLDNHKFIFCSDAHWLSAIGSARTKFTLPAPNAAELISAIKGGMVIE